MFRKELIIGIILLFFAANVVSSIQIKEYKSSNMAEWFEDFNDGDISDWTIENPCESGTSPVTLIVSNIEYYSSPYSILIHSPNQIGYSGEASGPNVPVDLSQNYKVEFWFRWNNFHFAYMVTFGHICAVIDYPYLPICYIDSNGEHKVGPTFQSFCPANTWTHFEFNVNPSTSSYTIIVNGNPIFTFNYMCVDPFPTQFSFCDSNGWGSSPNYFDHCYYDDIHVVYTPLKYQRAFFFGKIKNLSSQEEFIQFEAVKTRVFTINPLSFNTYTSGEKFCIKKEYRGFINLNYIFAIGEMLA